MPGNPRAIVTEAAPIPHADRHQGAPGGIGRLYPAMTEWLNENCGIKGWSIAPAGTRGILNDAVAVYVSSPTCAVSFVARWCIPGDPPGFYGLRDQEPASVCRSVDIPHRRKGVIVLGPNCKQ